MRTRPGRSLAGEREPVLGASRPRASGSRVVEHVAHQLQVPRVVLDDQDHGLSLGHVASWPRPLAGAAPRGRRARRARPRRNVPFCARKLIWPAAARGRRRVMSFDVSTTIGTSATSRVGAQALDDLEAVDVRASAGRAARRRPLARGRARTPSSPPVARSTDQPSGASTASTRSRSRGSSSIATTVRPSPGWRDAARQRAEQRVAVDRLDEVLGGAEREARAALVEHRHDHDRERRTSRGRASAARAAPSRRAAAAGRRGSTAAGREPRAPARGPRRRRARPTTRVAGALEDRRAAGRPSARSSSTTRTAAACRRPRLADGRSARGRAGRGGLHRRERRDRERERAALAELGSPSTAGRRAGRRSAATA